MMHRMLVAALLALLAGSHALRAQAPADAETVLIIDTPSGINRFVRAAHALHAEEAAAGVQPTRWLLRTTRQVDAAGPDSLRAWIRAADRAVVRLAVGELARSVGAELDAAGGSPATVWVYHSDPALMRRSRIAGRVYRDTTTGKLFVVEEN